MKKYDEMTDGEVRKAATQIALSAKSKEEVQRRLKDELGYPFTADVLFSSPGMVMGMMWGPTGNVIDF